MSDSLDSTASSSIDANVERGYSIVYRAIDLLGFGIAVACAWSCSSLVLGTIMFLVTGVVMALLAYAAKLMFMLRSNPEHMEKLGRACDVSRVTNFFKRAPAPTATPA